MGGVRGDDGHVQSPNVTDGDAAGRASEILVVDDNDLVRDMCALVLRRAGHVTHAVESGAAALAALGEHGGIEVVLTDLGLPGEPSGPALVQGLLQREPAIGVVAMSGHADLAGRVADTVATLAKPFSMDELLGAVDLAVDVTRRRRAAPT
jgi:DNA-binding NtrC family response regulator